MIFKEAIISSLFLIFLANIGSSQLASTNENPFNFHAEYGYAFTSPDYLKGDMVSIALQKEVYPNLYMGVAIGFLKIQKVNKQPGYYTFLGVARDGKAKSVNLHISYDFINKGSVKWGIEGGLFYRSWKWLYITGPYSAYYPQNNTLHPSDFAFYVYDSWGYTISTLCKLEFTERVGTSFRLMYQTDSHITGIVNLNLGMYVRF